MRADLGGRAEPPSGVETPPSQAEKNAARHGFSPANHLRQGYGGPP